MTDRAPFIYADWWVSRRIRVHIVHDDRDDPLDYRSKDLGEVFEHLAQLGYAKATIVTDRSTWQVDFRQVPHVQTQEELDAHG